MVYVFYLLVAVFQSQASDNLENYFWDHIGKFLRLNVRKATVIATRTVNINLHKVWGRTKKELKNYNITLSSIVRASTCTFNILK